MKKSTHGKLPVFSLNLRSLAIFSLVVVLSGCAELSQIAQDSGIPLPGNISSGTSPSLLEGETSNAAVNQALQNVTQQTLKKLGNFVQGGDDVATVRSYSRTKTYIWQGATNGILVGVGANCVANITKDKKCLDKAGIAGAIGGGLGATGGWIAATRQNKLENQAITLDQELNAARLELEQARLNREAAQRLIKKQSTEIAELRKTSEQVEADKKKLKKKLKTLETTQKYLENSLTRMDSEIASLEESIESQQDRTARRELASIKSRMIAEKNLLNKEMALLESALG